MSLVLCSLMSGRAPKKKKRPRWLVKIHNSRDALTKSLTRSTLTSYRHVPILVGALVGALCVCVSGGAWHDAPTVGNASHLSRP